MTWFPLQAALKMSTLPGAIRATLDVLLDHTNPAPQDPTRPDTLIVWESRERLAAEAGFSEVTIRDHLLRLRGEKDLRKGQRVMVLRCVEAPQSHRAARYELLPAALDALVDPARLEAFEAGTPRDTHPYERWRQWRASQMAAAAVGESALPQAPDQASVGVSPLPQAEAVGVTSLPQLGKAPYPELTSLDPLEQLTPFVPDAASLPVPQSAPEKKWSPQSPMKDKTTTKTKTLPPHGDDRRHLLADLMAWAQDHAPGVHAERILDLWLHDSEAKQYAFRNWLGEGKTRLRAAYWDARDRADRAADRSRSGLTLLWDPPRAARPDDADWKDPEAPVSHHTVCGMTHQRGVPCPQGGRQTTPMAAD